MPSPPLSRVCTLLPDLKRTHRGRAETVSPDPPARPMPLVRPPRSNGPRFGPASNRPIHRSVLFEQPNSYFRVGSNASLRPGSSAACYTRVCRLGRQATALATNGQSHPSRNDDAFLRPVAAGQKVRLAFVKGRDRWRQPILADEQVRESQAGGNGRPGPGAIQGMLQLDHRCLFLRRWLALAIRLSLRQSL